MGVEKNFLERVRYSSIVKANREGAAMRYASISAIACVLFLSSVASGASQSVDLVCAGDMFDVPGLADRRRARNSARPAATSVDIDNKRILTPFGEFRISWMDAGKVSFDGEQGHLRVSGSLDRQTGKMTVVWQTPEEEAKVRAGRSGRGSMFAELNCSLSKRLF